MGNKGYLTQLKVIVISGCLYRWSGVELQKARTRILRTLHPKHKEGGKPYFLDKGKTFHFYANCPSITGRVKKVSIRRSIRYSLCDTCRKRSDSEIHKIATDLISHWDSNVKELMSNVSKSTLPDDDKASTIQIGLMHMKLVTLMYVLMDNVGKKEECVTRDIQLNSKS